MRARWVIMGVAVCLVAMPATITPSTERTDGEGETAAALGSTHGADALVASLRKALRAGERQYALEFLGVPWELNEVLKEFVYTADPHAKAALDLIDAVKAELEAPEAFAGPHYVHTANRVLQTDFVPHLEETSELGSGRGPEWFGDAVLSRMRGLVANTRLPMDVRIETARLLAANGLRGGAADFLKLYLTQNPPGEDQIVSSAASAWQSWTQPMKEGYLRGFINGLSVRAKIDGAVQCTVPPSFAHPLGVYVLEMDVFYEKAKNCDVPIIEAMFRVQDALATR